MNWKSKSAAAIVAGGLVGAGDASAQPVGTNLIQNPSFEVLDGSNNVTQWSGTALGTYQYSQGYTSVNVPPNPGLNYLHGLSGSATSNTTQTVDLVAAGFTPAFIDAGVQYNLSAYFSSYFQTDFGSITVTFLDGGGATLGTSSPIGGQAFVAALGTGPNINGTAGYTDWGQSGTSGSLPVGTRSILLDILQTRAAGTANDAYVDAVDFQITAVPEPGTILLTSAAGMTLVLRLRRRDGAGE